MINHLVWSGVDEAEDLLRASRARTSEPQSESATTNRPLERGAASTRCCALDRRDLPHRRRQPDRRRDPRPHPAVDQGRQGRLPRRGGREPAHLAHRDRRRPRRAISTWAPAATTSCRRSMQIGLRVSLVRRFFTDDLEFINIAKNYIEVARLLRPRAAHRLPGRRATASWAARAPACSWPSSILAPVGGARRRSSAHPRCPRPGTSRRTASSTSSSYNNLRGRPRPEVHGDRAGPPGVPAHRPGLQELAASRRRSCKGLAVALDDLGDKPLIVRSSSLLEDRIGHGLLGQVQEPVPGQPGRPSSERLDAAAATPSPRSTPRSSAPTPSSTAPSAACSTSTRRWGS
ncbi:MAG: hypothetical protein MZV64_67980 [Ignavibacteriales bacterium]|nr:hypothetical protein [Ignavibacteriales bacterium]